MSELSEADRFLLDQVRQGSADAWTQLVDRYQGRLIAFARSRMHNATDAEDLVQETFMSFLQGVGAYRGDAGLETYLFTILRRRIVDAWRGRRLNVCLLADVVRGDATADSAASDPLMKLPAPDPTASVYARRDEARLQRTEALAAALRQLVQTAKDALNFRDVQIAELLFYAQLRNKEVAAALNLRQQHVALIKHRWLSQLRQQVAASAAEPDSTGEFDDGLLTHVWETYRLSCPKRSTIGAWLLGTLDPHWRDYVDFHLQRLGCRFCQANLDDLKKQNEGRDRQALRHRILESTVGFLRAT